MNNSLPTILILTPGFPKDEADNNCLPLQQTLLRAVKKEYPFQKIIVLSFQYPYQSAEYTWHGIPVISMGGRNKGGFHRLLLWKRIRKRLKRLKTENHITGVMSFWCGEAAYIGKRFAETQNIQWYCWILGQDARKENHYVKRINPPADALVALSNFIADEFERNHGIRPANYLVPGIEEPDRNKPLPKKDIDIVGAGSLIPLKQFGLFIDIIAEIKKSFKNIKVVIAGDGPERFRLQCRINEKGLGENITLAGEIEHTAVLSLMERSRLFLHTSSYEGFGMVCIEALYAGCQVISFTRPMKATIPNWYIVSGKTEMIDSAISFLQTGGHREREIYKDAIYMAMDFAALMGI